MPAYEKITTTIEREWLAEIIAGTKKIEYRQIKPYWTKRFAKLSRPFELRLLNGMNPPVPEVTVLIHRITKDRRAGEYAKRLLTNRSLFSVPTWISTRSAVCPWLLWLVTA